MVQGTLSIVISENALALRNGELDFSVGKIEVGVNEGANKAGNNDDLHFGYTAGARITGCKDQIGAHAGF